MLGDAALDVMRVVAPCSVPYTAGWMRETLAGKAPKYVADRVVQSRRSPGRWLPCARRGARVSESEPRVAPRSEPT